MLPDAGPHGQSNARPATIRGDERTTRSVSDRAALHSAKTPEWYTPPELIEFVRRVVGPIELDPASTPVANVNVGARRIFTMDDDGLSQSWTSPAVFLNPPGVKVGNRSGPGVWFEKLVNEYDAGRTQQAMFLGYRIDQLQSLQSGYGEVTPFDFPLVVFENRIRFLTERDDELVPGKSPSHGQWLCFLPPRDSLSDGIRLFRRVFRSMGQVIAPSPEAGPLAL